MKLKQQDAIAATLYFVKTELRRSLPAAPDAGQWAVFSARLDKHFPALATELSEIYGERQDFLAFLVSLATVAWNAWAERDPALAAQDLAREANPDWFQSESMLAGVCYADLYAGSLNGLMERIPYFKELGLTLLHVMPLFKCPDGNSDGGYAVSSYRDVNPALGSIEDLKRLATALRENGISLVLDFIFNHTSNEHEWALGCASGEEKYRDFYYIFPDRTMPDAYDRTLREIFPDQHPGSFSQLPDGRWIWTTFNAFQWDLNYSNPAVFTAMAGEMLAIANLGTDVLRMDAVAFVWKRLGTPCENLAEAHTVIRAFSALVRIAAPSLLFKSEAIVHPDDVVKYISPAECQMSYNPLQMALLWNSLATRETSLLQQALDNRHNLPEGTAWVNYVRSHDDIGWTFADEDAIQLGINGFHHRQFLNQFYVNRFPGSFARGVPFQDNPLTGDCRISGTTASLAGLEQGDPLAEKRILLLYSVAMSTGGIPLLYLGDETGTPNDYSYMDDPAKQPDSRWVNRPHFVQALHDARHDRSTPAGRIYAGFRKLAETRRATLSLGGNRLTGFHAGPASVLGYTRGHGNATVLVLANFSEAPARIEAIVFSAVPALQCDLLSGRIHDLNDGLALGPYEYAWLQPLAG